MPSKDSKDAQSVINKDSHSVASYNPNRYPSAKRERDDSTRKFDYGYLAALKSNMLPSDPDGRSHKKSIDNKTETNDGAYNRQLADEQVRRSKAEAELAKNKVEIEELKRKLGELAVENVQLKDRASREDTGLQHRLYDLNNELRSAKAQLERAGEELQGLRAEKGQTEGELLRRQKRMEALETVLGENNELKFQLESLRRAAEDARRLAQDRESQLLTEKYREAQEASKRLESARSENERLRGAAGASETAQKQLSEAQKQASEAEGQLRVAREELATKTRYIIDIEREK